MSKSQTFRDALQLVGKQASQALASAGQAAAMNFQAARAATSEKSSEFRDYIASPQFVTDLDELGGRLGLSAEALEGGHTHWQKVRHKTTVLARHAALETMLGTSVLKFGALSKVGRKRILPWIGIAATSAAVVRISYHCYQVFLAKKKEV